MRLRGGVGGGGEDCKRNGVGSGGEREEEVAGCMIEVVAEAVRRKKMLCLND